MLPQPGLRFGEDQVRGSLRCGISVRPMTAWGLGCAKPGSNSDFLLGGRTFASAECRHWSGRVVRWSSCAILLSCALPAGGAVRARRDRRAARRGRRRAASAPRPCAASYLGRAPPDLSMAGARRAAPPSYSLAGSSIAAGHHDLRLAPAAGSDATSSYR